MRAPQARDAAAEGAAAVDSGAAEVERLAAALRAAEAAAGDATARAEGAEREAARAAAHEGQIEAHAATIEGLRGELAALSAALVQVQLELRQADDGAEQRRQVLERASADAAALSRAALKNRELSDFAEQLQRKVVELSDANVELTSRAQAAEHRAAQLQCGAVGDRADVGAGPEVTKDQRLVDALYVQIAQLESEREQLLELVDGGSGAGGETEAAGLPPLPDGTQPEPTAQSEVQLALAQRQLAAAEVEAAELLARYAYCSGELGELRARLREEEERTMQLAVETETIGEYIALYQEHRQRSNERLAEKNRFIAELQASADEYCGMLAAMRETCAQLIRNGGGAGTELAQALAFAALPSPDSAGRVAQAAGADEWGAIEVAARGGGDPLSTPVPRHMFLDSSFREV